MGGRGFDLDTVVIGLPAFITACIGAITALLFVYRVSLNPNFLETNGDANREKMSKTIGLLQKSIQSGAKAFLFKEYTYLLIVALCLYVLVSVAVNWRTGLCYLAGAFTSALCGFIGMMVATDGNARTSVAAEKGLNAALVVSFSSGAVMGLTVVSLGLGAISCLLMAFNDQAIAGRAALTGFGMGASTVSIFARVAGGIFTKAADVGADLVGKVEEDFPEDDVRNPATIADNVGDNVGDVAGMGADLFGSFAEATCACLVIGSQCQDLRESGWGAIMFPLIVSTFGLVVCFVTSFVATHIYPVTTEHRVELALRLQLILSTVLMIPATVISIQWLPSDFTIDGVAKTFTATRWDAYVCVILGVVGGLIIGLITEYYTSKEFQPVLELVHSCKTGAATNIIYGLSLGYRSCIIPIFILAGLVYVSFEIADMYGVSLAACGMLSNLATGLTIDAYGPVCDNAGGIAEMAGLHSSVRKKTDALDAAGNTTAAVGKGFAIGSAALVSLALFGAFVTRLDHAEEENGGKTSPNVREILTPVIFAFLLIGAMIPYWFSALTMKSVGNAAMLMVEEVERQFKANPNLLVEGSTDRPDYKKCVEISTQASLKEMIAPGALVILTPLITGTFFGTNAVCAVLTGSLLSSVMLAISMSNTGGAWDNAKKYIELNPTAEYGAKGGDCHKAAVVGDTVGDPLKDTSGPALNIVMKLMAIISLVFANYFYQINDGHGLFGVPNDR